MKQALSRKNLWDKTPILLKRRLRGMLALIPPAYLLGTRFRRNLAFVGEAQWWSAERAWDYKLPELRRILVLAYEKTSFYRRAFHEVGFEPGDFKAAEDLRNLPTIDKSTLRRHLPEMCTVDPSSGGVDYVSTGGSSGQPLQFYIGSNRSATEYAFLVTTWQRVGYRLDIPQAVIRGQIVPEERGGLRHSYDPILRRHYYSNFHMSDENMRRYLEHIATIGPCFLHVYPSSAACLANYIQRSGTPPPANIQGVITESENVYPDQRALIERVFGVRVFSSYGHSEKLVLAAECEHSTDYHVWPTYGHFELLDEQGRPVTTPGQRGEIVGTGLINTVVPFIRYRTGDYATYVGDRCTTCGREHVLIRDVAGRWPHGALIAVDGSSVTMTALNVHDDTFAQVRQFQFYQDTPGRAVLRVIPSPGFAENDRRRIQRNLGRRLEGRLQFDIQLVDSIALSPRGKAIYVDQRIDTAGVRPF